MRRGFSISLPPLLAATIVVALAAPSPLLAHTPPLALNAQFRLHHPSREVHSEIEDLEKQWRRAVLAGDIKTMGSLLDDQYVGISANGTIQSKDQTLAARRAGTMKYSRLDVFDVKIRVYNDTAVVTSRADVAGSNGGEDISGSYRYTRVYHNDHGTWRIVSFEASRVGPSA